LVIGRDHLDTGSVASPNAQTEAMKDGSDAIADWPLLNALLNTACGASWVSLHHGRRRRDRLFDSCRHGVVPMALSRATADWSGCSPPTPETGVMRHMRDAGYELAIETARERGVDLR